MKLNEMNMEQLEDLRDDLEPIVGRAIGESADNAEYLAGEIQHALEEAPPSQEAQELLEEYGVELEEDSQEDAQAGDVEELQTYLAALADKVGEHLEGVELEVEDFPTADQLDALAEAMATENHNDLGSALKAVLASPTPAGKDERLAAAAVFLEAWGLAVEEGTRTPQEALEELEQLEEDNQADAQDEQPQEGLGDQEDLEEDSADADKVKRGTLGQGSQGPRIYQIQCRPSHQGVYKGDIIINPDAELERLILDRWPHTTIDSRAKADQAAQGVGARINRLHSNLED